MSAAMIAIELVSVRVLIAAAVGLASFYSTRELRDYLFFVAGATISFAWFLTQHFWFLEVRYFGLELSGLALFGGVLAE